MLRRQHAVMVLLDELYAGADAWLACPGWRTARHGCPANPTGLPEEDTYMSGSRGDLALYGGPPVASEPVHEVWPRLTPELEACLLPRRGQALRL